MKIHIVIAPTCFGLQPSPGSLYRVWIKLHFYWLTNKWADWQPIPKT